MMDTSEKLSIEELKKVPETLLYPLKSRSIKTKKKMCTCALPEFF